MIRPVYTLTLLFSLLTTVCAENRIADASSMGNDSIATKTSGTQLYIAEEDKTDYSKFAIKPIRVDTIWGDWEIHAHQFYDGNKFTYDKEGYKVSSKSLMGPN